ncbi:MAG TPA: inner membrane CreD family protein, partial [Candidatus Polarisedimenticolia bacterium]|nr:inner membrane CreD family protein [Candidatus Polarisedimenticolia bacterium]
VTDHIALPLQSSRVEATLGLDQRRKGLLWYNTYRVDFHARYQVRHSDPDAHAVVVHFDFPSNEALYDAFVLKVDGVDQRLAGDITQGISTRLFLDAGKTAEVEVSYRSRGLGPWNYVFAPAGVAQVHDFALQVTTDCDGFDFPAGSIAPGTKSRAGTGWKLDWKFDNLLTGQRIGIEMPHRLNPGPTAFRIIFFAPVALLFFVSVLVVLGIRSGWALHPMHYAFLSAAFFAFHLLLAYLVDHLDINLSFLIAGIASVLLVVTYLARVAGAGELLMRAAGAQVVFLLMFSYAFFFEGYSGLTVTVGSVLTLFVVMQATARLDWFEVFGGRRGDGSAPPVVDGPLGRILKGGSPVGPGASA